MLFNPALAAILTINCITLAVFLSNFLKWGAFIPVGLLWLPFFIGYRNEVRKARDFLEALFDATVVVS